MAQLPPLAEQTSDERIAQFERALGQDLADIDEDFIRYMRRVR